MKVVVMISAEKSTSESKPEELDTSELDGVKDLLGPADPGALCNLEPESGHNRDSGTQFVEKVGPPPSPWD